MLMLAFDPVSPDNDHQHQPERIQNISIKNGCVQQPKCKYSVHIPFLPTDSSTSVNIH